MAQEYNPIVRTFGRFRAAVVSGLGIARREVRPEARLDALIPTEARREVWRHLRREGLDAPPLHLTAAGQWLCALVVVTLTVGLTLLLQRWAALLAVVPLGIAAFWASRPWAVHLPSHLTTVGEVVLAMTSFREHRHSGYRWTRNEIAFKVRLTVAEAFGLPFDKVRPESTFEDLMN